MLSASFVININHSRPTIVARHDSSHVIIKSLCCWSAGKIRRELICQFTAYFTIAFFKYTRVQANDAQVRVINARVQATNVVHPGVDAVNSTVLSNAMCATRS